MTGKLIVLVCFLEGKPVTKEHLGINALSGDVRRDRAVTGDW